MSTTTDLTTLKINYLTQSQYEAAKEQGLIQSNEIYMTPEDSLLRSKVGAIIAYAGNDEPQGWLKCDGRAISRTNYKELFEVIGTIYGAGDESTTFNIPDLRNQFLTGAGDDYDIGDTGGASTVTLTIDEIPSHHHLIKYDNYNRGTGSNQTMGWIRYADGANAGNSEDVGGGQAHENKPPFVAVNFLICYENNSIGGGGSGGPIDSTDVPTAEKIAEFDSSSHMNSADMSAQDVSDFVDGLNIQKVLKTVETKTLLWTNTSPTSDFASQTVLNNGELSGYDGVEIMYKAYKTYGSSLVVKIEMDSSSSPLQGFINAGGTSVPMVFERPVSVSSSGVQFSACNSKSTNSSSTSANAGGCVPYKIYGYKMEQL